MFPPLAILAIVFFPSTLIVAYWMYLRGKRQAMNNSEDIFKTTRPVYQLRSDESSGLGESICKMCALYSAQTCLIYPMSNR